MKLCIKNQIENKITIDVPVTYTIRQVIEVLYNKNVYLKDYITLKVYEQAVYLSLNGTKFDLERTLADYGMDVLLRLKAEQGVNATSDLELSVLQGVNIPGLNNAHLIDLNLDAPEIPEELRCCLSTQIFRNPVLLPCGTLAEKAFILKWVKEKGTCPFTRQPLTEKAIQQLVPDIEKQKQVAAFLQEHKDRVYFKELAQQQYPEDEISLPSTPAPNRGPVDPDVDDRAAIDRVLSMLNQTLPMLRNNQEEKINTPASRIGRLNRNQRNVQAEAKSISTFDRSFGFGFLESQERMFFGPDHRFFNAPPRNPRFRSPINWSGNEYINGCIQETITEFQDYGVTQELIVRHWHPNHPESSWDGTAKETLMFLVKGTSPFSILRSDAITPLPENLRLQPIAALQEMSNLNDHAMKALRALYEKGLRGQDLRALRSFELGHESALVRLVRERNLSVNDALQQITDITEEQAWDIYRNIRRPTATI